MVRYANSIHNQIGGQSYPGGYASLSISNFDNTNAASAASLAIIVGGSVAYDPYVSFSIIGATNWVIGIDNSDSDKFKIGTALLGISDVLTSTTAGVVDIPNRITVGGGAYTAPGGNSLLVDMVASNANSVFAEIKNSDNANATAHSQLNIAVGGTSAGDPKIVMAGTATTWSLGVDNSVSDQFSINASGNPGTTDVFISQPTGEITMPLTSAFLAYNSVTDDNVTGDGTLYTIICNTEIYDQNSDYNNGTGIFTAPITGRYHFCAMADFYDLGAGHISGNFSFYTSNRNYYCWQCNFAAMRDANLLRPVVTTYADMDAGDTCYIVGYVAGSTKTVDIRGGADPITNFAGMLAC